MRGKEGLKQQEKQVKKEQQRGAEANPLEEREEELKREAAKLLRQTGNDWRKLGEELYAVYKQDKKKAFELVGIISREAEWRWINAPKLEDEELGKWLDRLDRNGLYLPLNNKRTAKVVLSLAALSGLREIENEEDVEKGFAITVLREAARSKRDHRREAAAKLIGELGLQEELLDVLIELAFDRHPSVLEAAAEAVGKWDKELRRKGSSVMNELEKRKKGWSEKLKERIRDAATSECTYTREAAAQLIGELGLQEEFLNKLMELAFDGHPNVFEAAAEALGKWDKELRRKGSSVMNELEKRKKGWSEEVKEWIRKVAGDYSIDNLYIRGAAPKLISELGLQQEEFLEELIELAFDPYIRSAPCVANLSVEALSKWDKELRRKGSSVMNELEKRKKGWSEEVKEWIRKWAREDEFYARYTTAKIIMGLGLQEELLDVLIELALDEYSRISAPTAEFLGKWNKELKSKGSSLMAELDKKRKGWANETKKRIRDAAMSGWGRRRAAAKFISELGLQEEFLDVLIELAFDRQHSSVVEAAAEALGKWNKELRRKGSSVMAELDKKRKGWANETKKRIIDAAMSGDWVKRYAAPKLIGELGLQEEFKPELMLLMFDYVVGVREVAEEAWDKAELDDVKEEYEQMKKKEKEMVKEQIREAARSDEAKRRYAAPKLIGEIGLQEEFKPELMVLRFDYVVGVRRAAEDAWKKAGLGDVKSEYEQMKKTEKEMVKEQIREAARSREWIKRYAVAKLIGELGLQEEFKAELMLLMFDYVEVGELAEDAWKKAGLGDVKSEYEQMKKKEKEMVKEQIREAARSDEAKRRYAAVRLIGELGLQEEFKPELMVLRFDRYEYSNMREATWEVWEAAGFGDVKSEYEQMSEEEKRRVRDTILEILGTNMFLTRSLTYLQSAAIQLLDALNLSKGSLWRDRIQGIKDEIKKSKASLPNPFALSEDVKLSERLLSAMVALCS